jgi:hypothetical protein
MPIPLGFQCFPKILRPIPLGFQCFPEILTGGTPPELAQAGSRKRLRRSGLASWRVRSCISGCEKCEAVRTNQGRAMGRARTGFLTHLTFPQHLSHVGEVPAFHHTEDEAVHGSKLLLSSSSLLLSFPVHTYTF